MKVCIDARILDYNSSGIGRYARGLLSALEASGTCPDLSVFRSWRSAERVSHRFSEKRLFTPPHFPLESMTLPIELSLRRVNVIHSLDFFCAGAFRFNEIRSIYDLYFLKDPSVMDSKSYAHYRQIAHEASAVSYWVCTSEATQKDLCELLNVDPRRTEVIYPGPPVCHRDVRSKQRWQSDEQYFLYVGTVEPRKNLCRLVRAYASLRARRDMVPKLVLAGSLGYRSGELLTLLNELKLCDDVSILGHVSDMELDTLYSNAEFVVYVSLYEGFGFPILEAMQRNKPLLLSSASCLPEIGGAAAVYVDPLNEEAIADGILELTQNNALREALSARCGVELARFSWNDCARKMIELYSKVGGEG